MKIDDKNTRIKKGDKIFIHLKEGTIGLARGGKKLRFSDGDDKYIVRSGKSEEPIGRNAALRIIVIIAESANLKIGEILADTENRLLVNLS